ncbi:hypothetical protein T05_1845 [Trichinella murrelli]|uniref:Uncharacterized protein n=1 Tax=Trichinella murrelli TaxID=144512 RepID=A0A0V0TES9_9BILA|nr:hypothetical protein T05_1845 [Trichinella murrelli]
MREFYRESLNWEERAARQTEDVNARRNPPVDTGPSSPGNNYVNSLCFGRCIPSYWIAIIKFKWTYSMFCCTVPALNPCRLPNDLQPIISNVSSHV